MPSNLRSIYVVTDSESDNRQLARVDLDSGDQEILTSDIPWDIDNFQLSDDGTRAAFEVNEGGISRLYLMDPADHSYVPVETLPVGLIGGLTFSLIHSQHHGFAGLAYELRCVLIAGC